MISGAQKKILERKHAARKAAFEKKNKVKFGELAWDHMRVCRHDLEATGNGELPCSFCRLVQMQAGRILKEEDEKAAEARAQSIVRRGMMRYSLVTNWSKNQSAFYADIAVPGSTINRAWTVDVGISRSVAISLEEYSGILEAEVEFKKRYPELFMNVESRKEEEETINMDVIGSTLHRRRLIQAVGSYAAVYIQSRIRKMIQRRGVRRKMMQRFEKVLSVDGHSEILIDQEKGMVERLPVMIEDINIKSPRTMGRRVNAIEKKRQDRSARFQKYMEKFRSAKGSATPYLDFDEMERQKMYHLRNVISFRDAVTLAFEGVLNHSRNDWPAPVDGSVSTVKSKASKSTASVAESRKSILSRVGKGKKDGKDKDKDKDKDKEGPVDDATVLTVEEDAQSLAASLTSLSVGSVSRQDSPSVMIGMSAPGPPSRDLGLSIAIRSSSFVLKRGGAGRGRKQQPQSGTKGVSGEVTMKVLIAMMRRVDDYAWEALRCTSAEDVVDKFLLEDLHPPMQSCIHMADDSEEFWCSTRATHVENEERAEAERGREREQKEAAQAQAQAQAHAKEEPRHPTMSDNQVLPISLQLRPFPVNKPKNVFRLFFLEQELVAVTPMCTWSYYPDIARKKDNIVKELKEWAISKDVTNFVHAYYVKANAKILEAVPQNEFNFDSARRLLAAQQKEEANATKNYRTNFGGGTAAAQTSREKTQEAKVGPGIRPLFAPPQEALYDADIYQDEGALPAQRVADMNARFKFLHKMSSFKPLVVRAQNQLMAKKKKKERKPTAAEASGVADSSFQSWAVTSPNVLGVLTRSRPSLAGEELYDLVCQERFVEGGGAGGRGDDDDGGSVASAMSFATQSKYYRRFVDLAINTDVSVKDRVKLPKTHSQLVREWEAREAERRREAERKEEDEERRRYNEAFDTDEAKAEAKERAAAEEDKKNDWESDDEQERKEEAPDPRPQLPEVLLNLMVLEVIFPNVAPGAAIPSAGAGAGAALASVSQDTAESHVSGGDVGGMVEEEDFEQKDKSTTMGKPELFQVVGVFNADRELTPREPGGLDMGLVDWEDILVAADVGKFHRTRHPLEWLSFPGTTNWGGSYFVQTEKSARPWSAPDERGVCTFSARLKSRKNFSLSLVGAPPPKEYLMNELPRNVRRWIGLE